MRAGIFSLAYTPFVGGAEIAVKEITERLPNFDFQIFTHDFKRRGYGKLAKFFYVFRAWRAAEKSHRQKPFDAIWAIMAAYGGLAALLFKLRHPKMPFLLTLQEGDSEGHILKRVGVFYPLWKLIFKKADYVQAISDYLADFARRHGAKCQIDVVPNGVNLTKFQNPSASWRTKSQNPKSKTIITTSRLVHKNGVDILIRATAHLKTLIPNSEFIIQILGGGPDEQKLKNLAAELGVSGEVRFLGHIEPDKISEYLLSADIFARPSRSEGLGNSFLEAMAAGLPVIGTPVGGIPDFLKDGETGLFCKVDDPQNLAEKITLLLNNGELCKKLGENGRKLVFENYSWDGIAERMSSIFKKFKIENLKLKILIATGIYPPDIGGPATYAKLLEEELPKRGFRISVLPFTKYRRLPKIIRHFAYFFRCLWLSREAEFIYAQDPVSVGLPAMLVSKLTGKKFIIRVAGDYAWEQAAQRFGVKDGIDEFQQKKYDWRTEFLRRIQKFVVGRADLVITPSKYFQKLVSGWIKDPEKVEVIYNGIQLENPNPKIQISNKSQNPNPKTILSAGRLVPWKGFDVLIELMKDLPDWRLIIVGDGPEHQNLKFKIENLKLTNRVVLTGRLPREKLLDYLSKAQIFVLNTSFESFSFQVVEAMNAGTPVITTNIGNLAEIIDDGKEGILVEPNNKEQILAAIGKIGSDGEFRQKIIANAKEKAKQFSIEKTVDNLVNLLNDLCRTPK